EASAGVGEAGGGGGQAPGGEAAGRAHRGSERAGREKRGSRGPRPERVGRVGEALREGDPRRLTALDVAVGHARLHQAEDVRRDDGLDEGDLHSTNVTLLTSFNVVHPSKTLARAASRRKAIPSSLAAFLISAAGRRSRISPRIRSDRSRSSAIAIRPWKPVPSHSRHPFPS